MRRKSLLLMLTLSLVFVSILPTLSNINALPQLDNLIVYMVATNLTPTIGDQINVTVVFKNYLNNTASLANVTMKISTAEELNITQVLDVPYKNSAYNLTEYLQNANSTTPIFWWTNRLINITWAKYDQNMSQTFWFSINCTEVSEDSGFQINDPNIEYKLAGKKYNFLGEGLTIRVNAITTPTSVSKPIRGDWMIFWWFAGTLLVATPVVIILLTRLTLWKR